MPLTIDQTSLSIEKKKEFWSADPFPFIVFDGFLPDSFARNLLVEISQIDNNKKSNDYIFAKNKFENPSLDFGPFAIELRDFMLSNEFSSAISSIYGNTVFIDSDFVGGGVHRGGAGSFLDMHVDFGVHPGNKRWVRELNILLYLNSDWKPEYGGNLLLKNKLNGKYASIEPIFNRLVVMQTKSHTLHGYREISFPQGTFRTSIAAYAYSVAKDDAQLEKLITTTQWSPEEAGVLKRIIALITPKLVIMKQSIMGSSTMKKK